MPGRFPRSETVVFESSSLTTMTTAPLAKSTCSMREWFPLRVARATTVGVFLKRQLATLLALAALLLAPAAVAGNVSFGLSVNGTELVVTNQGNTSAFYPAVFRLKPDNSWARLEAVAAPAELAPGAHLQLVWPDTAAEEQLSAVVSMQPLMVRFFDQAGVGFGQISFFRTPAENPQALKAGYAGGRFRIEPPEALSAISATWVLWGQEDGIRPIRRPVRLEHHQPPAVRIDWQRQGKEAFELDTGAGLPSVSLLHQTAQGFVLQPVPDGGLQGREQRAVWLDSAPMFYAAAALALVIAASTLLLEFLRRPRVSAAAAPTTMRRATPGPLRLEPAIQGPMTTASAAAVPGAPHRAKKNRGKSRRAKTGKAPT